MNKDTAQHIAESASEIVGYGVLVTDEQGIIIGCNDSKRVGTLHAPSLEVMAGGESLATSRIEAASMDGVKPGYTSAIAMGDRIVGTVSIAGPPEKVERYGKLVQKHAEIMLREQSIFESHIRKEQSLRDLAQNILMFKPEDENEQSIFMQGQELGYDIQRCRIAVVFEMKQTDGKWIHALQSIRNFFSKPSHLIAHLRDFQVIAFLDMTESNVAVLCKAFLDYIAGSKMEVDIGIGIESKDLRQLAVSGRTAREALFVGKVVGDGRIHSANKLSFEMMLASVSRKRRIYYMEQILGNFERNDSGGELRKTFCVWCENPFSPADVAEKLHIHRNTLNHRLKKICKLTGLNIWKMHDAFVLWSAMTLKTFEEKKTALKRS